MQWLLELSILVRFHVILIDKLRGFRPSTSTIWLYFLKVCLIVGVLPLIPRSFFIKIYFTFSGAQAMRSCVINFQCLDMVAIVLYTILTNNTAICKSTKFTTFRHNAFFISFVSYRSEISVFHLIIIVRAMTTWFKKIYFTPSPPLTLWPKCYIRSWNLYH